MSLNKFNIKSKEWLSDLISMDKDEIQIKPSETSWSIAELYDHVMKVAYTFQIPNLKKSLTPEAESKKSKNFFAFILFNLGFLPNLTIQMNSFPKDIAEMFTPVMKSKEELVTDFKKFIIDVNELEKHLLKANKKSIQYHPMFGDINTKEWLSLIEIHLRHHDKQKKKIKKFIINTN